MTKFTKGPWEVYAELNVRSVSGDAVAACGPQRGLSDDGGNAENKANAALIAAAPELYEALREAAEIINELCDCFGHPLPEASIERINSALAKASP